MRLRLAKDVNDEVSRRLVEEVLRVLRPGPVIQHWLLECRLTDMKPARRWRCVTKLSDSHELTISVPRKDLGLLNARVELDAEPLSIERGTDGNSLG